MPCHAGQARHTHRSVRYWRILCHAWRPFKTHAWTQKRDSLLGAGSWIPLPWHAGWTGQEFVEGFRLGKKAS